MLGFHLPTQRQAPSLVQPRGRQAQPQLSIAGFKLAPRHTTRERIHAHRTDTMEENRLFRFPRPAWLNNANTRTFGVYTAGAMVGSTSRCTHAHR